MALKSSGSCCSAPRAPCRVTPCRGGDLETLRQWFSCREFYLAHPRPMAPQGPCPGKARCPEGSAWAWQVPRRVPRTRVRQVHSCRGGSAGGAGGAGCGVWWDGSRSRSPRGRGSVWAPGAGGACGRTALTWHPGPAAIPLPRRGARHVPAVLGPFPRLTAIPSSQPIPNPGLDRSSSASAPAQLPALLPASPRVPVGLGAQLTGVRSSPRLFSPVTERVELLGAPGETFPVLQQPLHYPAGPPLSHLQSSTTAWH